MNNKLPVGLFDMDWTTFDFATPLYDLIQAEKSLPEQVRTTLADINNRTTIQLRKLFPEYEAQQHDAIKHTIEWLYQTEDFFKKVKPYPGIVETLKDLNEHYHIKFCTKPSKRHCGSESAKRDAIIKYFGGQWSERMITTHDKTEVRGAFLVDDTPIITWRYTPERKHILVDQPHNRTMQDMPRLFIGQQEEWQAQLATIMQ